MRKTYRRRELTAEAEGVPAVSAAPVEPVTLRRAVAFVRDHVADDVSVVQIAAACGVTVRALQLAFRRHLGTTPSRYLRELRLDRVRRELRAGDPAHGDTVTEVAARWGFFSPGRFSAHYREAFGEPPSHTLRG